MKKALTVVSPVVCPVLVLLCLALIPREAAAQGGQCYGARCNGSSCGGGQNYQGWRPCCCGQSCLVKPDRSVTCMCALGCYKQCGVACAVGCNGENCGQAMADPPTSLVAFVADAPEVAAAMGSSGYGPMLANLLSNYGKWSGGTGALSDELRSGTSAISGNVDTYFLPEPWRSLPPKQNLVGYKALIVVNGPEAAVTLVFDNLSLEDLLEAGARRLRRVPPAVTIRLAMAVDVAEIHALSVEETEAALQAMKEACERDAGVTP